MAKEIAKKKLGLIETIAVKYNLDPATFLNTVKATVMRPGKDGRIASNEEIAAFLVVANKYNLDPFTNEIYAFPSKKGGIIPIIGVDGFVSMVNRHPDFNGMEIEYSDEVTTMEGAKSCPEWCEVKIYRKNTERPVIVREYLDEVYCPPKGGYPGPWQSHTKRMLRHKTIIQGARVAFGITGVYDPDEGNRILEAEAVIVEPSMKPAIEIPQAIDLPSPATEENETQEPEPEKENLPTTATSTPAQHRTIHILVSNLVKAKKWKNEHKLYEVLGGDYSVESTKELSGERARQLIDRLSKELNGK